VTLRTPRVLASCAVLLLAGSVSCNSTPTQDQRQRDEKTREEAAKATERIKPDLKEAGKELGQAARQTVEDAKAAAEGVKEGWNRDHAHPLALNSASEDDLSTLPGISRADARKIIRGRPYRSKDDLVTKGILSREDYSRIRDYISTD
jgi:DNA uptake protein ComE-like DNA-binding protein